MNAPSLNDVKLDLKEYSVNTWERLGYVKESQMLFGGRRSIRFGEETITDLMMMDLYLLGSDVFRFVQTPKAIEAKSGTDMELWLGSHSTGWFCFAIQAKRLELRSERYSSLGQANSNGKQIDLLETYAQRKQASALYCLYNYADHSEVDKTTHCCDGTVEQKELGCTVTPLSNIREAINKKGARNFTDIHKKANTRPLRCLVACPNVQNVLANMQSTAPAHQALGHRPLFDYYSCYHAQLPSVLRREEYVPTKENENGGALVPLRLTGSQGLNDRTAQTKSVPSLRFTRTIQPRHRRPQGGQCCAAADSVELNI